MNMNVLTEKMRSAKSQRAMTNFSWSNCRSKFVDLITIFVGFLTHSLHYLRDFVTCSNFVSLETKFRILVFNFERVRNVSFDLFQQVCFILNFSYVKLVQNHVRSISMQVWKFICTTNSLFHILSFYQMSRGTNFTCVFVLKYLMNTSLKWLLRRKYSLSFKRRKYFADDQAANSWRFGKKIEAIDSFLNFRELEDRFLQRIRRIITDSSNSKLFSWIV